MVAFFSGDGKGTSLRLEGPESPRTAGMRAATVGWLARGPNRYRFTIHGGAARG